MNNQVVAILIQEGSRFLSDVLRNRAPKEEVTTTDTLERYLKLSEERMAPFTTNPEQVIVEQAPTAPTVIKIQQETPPETVIIDSTSKIVPEGKASSIVSGCVPCALGHVGAGSGLLNEGMRFAHTPEGMSSPEVIDRINMCLDELNTMERIDLRPEMLVQLQGWEKELAEKTLTESRAIRHKLEAIMTVEDLEQVAAQMQTTRQEIGRGWFQKKLSTMSPDDKEEIKSRVMAKIEELAKSDESVEVE